MANNLTPVGRGPYEYSPLPRDAKKLQTAASPAGSTREARENTLPLNRRRKVNIALLGGSLENYDRRRETLWLRMSWQSPWQPKMLRE